MYCLDDNPMTDEEMNASEDKVAIFLMKLLGIPQQLRHNIYREALHNIQAMQEVSSGTIDIIGNLVDWVFPFYTFYAWTGTRDRSYTNYDIDAIYFSEYFTQLTYFRFSFPMEIVVEKRIFSTEPEPLHPFQLTLIPSLMFGINSSVILEFSLMPLESL